MGLDLDYNLILGLGGSLGILLKLLLKIIHRRLKDRENFDFVRVNNFAGLLNGGELGADGLGADDIVLGVDKRDERFEDLLDKERKSGAMGLDVFRDAIELLYQLGREVREALGRKLASLIVLLLGRNAEICHTLRHSGGKTILGGLN